MGFRGALLSVGALVAAAAMLGYIFGARQAALTETDVITRYATRHVERNDLDPEALRGCFARPGRDGPVWIVVICGTDAYFVGRDGALLHHGAPSDRPFAPEGPEA